MLKKITILIMVLICIGAIAYADSDITAEFQIDYSANKVTVFGDVTGSANWVTIYVESPTNRLEYIGSAKVINGEYDITFGLMEPSNNTDYTGMIKAEGMSEAIPFSFTYKFSDVRMRTAGIEYEQIHSDLPDIAPLTLNDVEVEVLNLTKGIYRLTVTDDDYSIDSRGSAFFFWSTTEGEFSEISPDFKSVVFSADAGTGCENVRIDIGIGDHLGQVDRKAILLKGNDYDGGF